MSLALIKPCYKELNSFTLRQNPDFDQKFTCFKIHIFEIAFLARFTFFSKITFFSKSGIFRSPFFTNITFSKYHIHKYHILEGNFPQKSHFQNLNSFSSHSWKTMCSSFSKLRHLKCEFRHLLYRFFGTFMTKQNW